MKRPELKDLNDAELATRFAGAGRQMGSAVLDSETGKANRIFQYMEDIDEVLRSRGNGSRLSLAPLLDDKNRFVRYYAAQYLLGIVPDRARAIIEWNYKYGFDAIAGDAGMTLHNLDTGFYKPD